MPSEVVPAGTEGAFAAEGWTLGTEVPDADAQEQRQPVAEEDEAADPETVAGRAGTAHHDHAIATADEADLVEQDAEVGYDDDEDRG